MTNNETTATNSGLASRPLEDGEDALALAMLPYQEPSGGVPTHIAPPTTSGSRPGLSTVSYGLIDDEARAAAAALLDLSGANPVGPIGSNSRRFESIPLDAFAQLKSHACCMLSSLVGGGLAVSTGYVVSWVNEGKSRDGFTLSRQSAGHRVHAAYDSCCLRYASKHIASGGIVSCWKAVEGNVNYMYFKDGRAVYDLILRHRPQMTHAQLNKLQKIRNGNTAREWDGDSDWPADAVQPVVSSFVLTQVPPGDHPTLTTHTCEVDVEYYWHDEALAGGWAEVEVAPLPGAMLAVYNGVAYATYCFDSTGYLRPPFGPHPDRRVDRPTGPFSQLQYSVTPLGPVNALSSSEVTATLLLISGIEPNPGPCEIFNHFDPLVPYCDALAENFLNSDCGGLLVLEDGEDYSMNFIEESALPLETLFDDAECFASLTMVAPVVAAWRAFDLKPERETADRFNFFHRMMDCCGDKGSELSQGPRLRTKFDVGKDGPKPQSAKPKRADGAAKKGTVQKIRDNVRRRRWLDGLEPTVAEAWVRANKPDPSQVAGNSDYLSAYGARTRRGEFYTKGVEDAATFMLFDFIDAEAHTTRGCEWLGPMSRKLIQDLLVIGNIELQPGPTPALAANNFGYTGNSHNNAVSAGINFLLSTQIDQLDPIDWPVDIASLDPLARPAVVPGTATVGYHGMAEWIISHSYVDSSGIQFNQPYRRVWRGEWAVETYDDTGLLVDFPDDACLHGLRLVGKIHVRDPLTSAIDGSKPVLLIYRYTPDHINRQVRPRSGQVTVGGGGAPPIQISYFRGRNSVAVNCGSTGSFEVPTNAWAECEKFFASGIKRQVATSNASQVLRNAGVDGSHFGIILLALSEAMLPAAAVSTAVATHREAAIERAKRGQSMRYGWIESIAGRGPRNPDYHGMLHSSPEPPWQAVWAARATLAGVGAFLCVNGSTHLWHQCGVFTDATCAWAHGVAGWIAQRLNPDVLTDRRKALQSTYRYNPFFAAALVARNITAIAHVQSDFVSAARQVTPLTWTEWLQSFYVMAVPMRPTSASVLPGRVLSIFVAPIFEEACRKVSPLVTPFLIIYETARLWARGHRLLPSVVDRTFVHGCFHVLPFWAAVPAHMVYNVASNDGDSRFDDLGWGVVQKGVKWFASDPMGVRSTYDALYLRTKPAIDPLMNLVIKAPRLFSRKGASGRVFSLFPSILDLTSYKPNRGNFVQSAVGRVGRVTPQITSPALLEAVQEAVSILADNCRSRFGMVEPVPFDDFVNKFPPAKAAAYREAAELFEAVGTRPIYDKQLYKDFRADECAAFIKHELNADCPDLVTMVKGVRFESAASDCRTILPRWLPLQSQMIPYILAMEKNVKELLADMGPALFGKNLRFASGLNNRELGEMARELMLENGLDSIIVNGDDAMFTVRGVAYYVDGKRWDAHFRAEHHYCIIDAYARMGLPSHLVLALRYLVNRKIRWGEGISATIERNNASGESDTTFRNGIQNVLTLLVALRESDFVSRAMALGFVYEVCAVQVDVRAPIGDFCARTWIHTDSGGELILKVGRVTAKMCSTGGSSIPFAELRVAKVEAAIRDLSAFPEVCVELARLNRGVRSTQRAVDWVRAQKYDKTEASNVVTSIDQRCAYFAGRYGVDYLTYVAELRSWCGDVLRGAWPDVPPLVRLVSEIDMAVSSVSNTPGAKQIRLQGTLHLGGAHAKWVELSRSGMAAWLASAWSSLMHMMNGNGVVSLNGVVVALGLVLMLILSAGGREWREFIPEQTLSYQRQQFNKAIIRMPNNKHQKGAQKGNLARAVKDLKIAETQLSKASSKWVASGPSKGQKQRASAKYAKAGHSAGAVLSRRPWTNFSSEAELWRKSILDPFTYQGVHTCGEFYTRGVVPYTIKRSIQLGAASVAGATFVFNPSLNNMCWNPDGGAYGLSGFDTWVQSATAPSTANAVPLPPVVGASTSIGVSLPGLAASFEKFRIVSWGVKLRCDAAFNNTGGRVVVATLPYEGYLPYVASTSGGTGTSATLPCIDNSISNGAVFLTNTASVYQAHPNTVVADRPLTTVSILNDMGIGASGPTQFQSLVNVPGSKVYTINDIAGREIMVSSLPCSLNVYGWRDTGNSSTLANPGTSTEVIYLNAGSDAFPGAIQTSTAVAPTVNGISVSTAVDASSLKALGFETVVVCLSGVPNQVAVIDAEVIYNIEALPNVKAAVNFAGVIPSTTLAPRNVVAKAEAESMLRSVSVIDPITIRDVVGAAGPLLAAAAGPSGALLGAGVSALSAMAGCSY